jgi:signal transduction histidine kinase
MAVKIAHEIRNPLGSIELFASILKKDLENFGELKTLAEHVSSGVKSINNIISNLLLFIRPEQRPDFKLIDIHDFLDDSLFFSGHLLNSNGGIDVTTCFPSEPLTILGDTELLKQACLNVILNCIQAMPDVGKLTVSVRKTKGENRNEDLAEIRFDDTGIGISRDDKHKIFDPFFTTKKRGTGLGLPIVHNIVKLHGGSVDINSTEGGGTVCIFTLPLINAKTGQNGVEAGCSHSRY